MWAQMNSLPADGVNIDEEERRREEDRWLKGAERREKRQAERANRKEGEEAEAERQTTPGDVILTGAVEDLPDPPLSDLVEHVYADPPATLRAQWRRLEEFEAQFAAEA